MKTKKKINWFKILGVINWFKILGVIVFIGGLVTMMIVAISLFTEGNTKEVVKCYDEHNNEIIGLECISEEYDSLTLLFMEGMTFVFLGVLIYVIGKGMEETGILR